MQPSPNPSLAGLARELAADLAAAGYSVAALRDAWGATADQAHARGLVGPALAALGTQTDALAVIARLFGLGVAQPVNDVDRAFLRTKVDGLVALGLVQTSGDTVHPLVLVRPRVLMDSGGVHSLWVASDLDEAALGGPLPTDHVLGVGGASLTLAGLQLPTRAVRVLDLGTGCGIQALRAREYADEVVATDISERALWFTELNAAINGLEGISTRLGSLFDPVAGENFDRVVSNPPFVITPRRTGVPAYEYRDGGLAGDDLVRAVITGVGEVLAPDGVAQLLGNWEYRGDVSGLDRVREWVGSSSVPLDAWVIERERLSPLAYAELWVRDGGTAPGTPEYAELIGAWLDDFAARGVSEVGFGYVLLHRPASGIATLARYEQLSQPLGDALGAHLAAALAVHIEVQKLSDDELAASILTVAADVTEARHHMPGVEDPSVIELRQGGALARTIEVDPALAALVGACDGELSVGVLIDAIAQLLEVDAAELRADLLPRVRELLFNGFLY